MNIRIFSLTGDLKLILRYVYNCNCVTYDGHVRRTYDRRTDISTDMQTKDAKQKDFINGRTELK